LVGAGERRAVSGWVRKDFFFAKKKQKTFASFGAPFDAAASNSEKFFGSFFQKRTSS
jgi:hypothetical protein